jgi:preprotein translocase subunit SecG
MQTVIIVIHLMIVLAMIGVVLLQKSEGGGLGMGGGSGFLSSRGSANVLTRTTAMLALGFFLTSLLLSILAGSGRKQPSILQNAGATTPATAPAPGAPPPLEQGGGGLLDTLRGQPAPGAPSAPAEGGGTPQVPRSQ